MTDRQAGGDAFSAATSSLQAFAEETHKLTAETLDETWQVMERMSGAKSLQEIFALQTSLLQSAAARHSAYMRKVAELMAAGSTGLFREP